MVRQWQKLYYNSRMSGSDKSLRKKDFIKAAEADGFKYAVRLDKKADMERVIGEWLKFPGAAFLEVIIDRDAGVYPMVGPGLAYDQMITGDFMPTRKQGQRGRYRQFRNVLARILHELPELSVDFTSAAWLIVCRSIAIAMVQAGSAGMCREIRRQTGSGTFCTSCQTRISLTYH